MNDIVKRTEDMLDIVSNYRAEDMTMVFAKLSALKSALESADMFFEASVQFARLEAYALIRAVELSDGKRPELKGKNRLARATAGVWLYNMTESERNAIIEQCKEGKTVVSIYRELHHSNKEKRFSELKKDIIKNLLDDLKEEGICSINNYERYLNRIDPSLRQDVKDGIRSKLLLSGAVGIEDRQGTYIVPERNEQKIEDALMVRMRSICSDFLSFMYLASNCSSKPYFKLGFGNGRISPEDILLLFACSRGAIHIYTNPYVREQLKTELNALVRILDAEEKRQAS